MSDAPEGQLCFDNGNFRQTLLPFQPVLVAAAMIRYRAQSGRIRSK